MSLFGSIKDKLSKKSRSRSPSPNPSFGNSFDSTSRGTIPVPPSDSKPNSFSNEPPPPPYSATAGPSSSAAAAPAIAVHAPSAAPARAPSPAPSFSSARSDPSITSVEDRYAFLSSFDTIFLIDDSGSMAGSRWRETGAALRAVAPICTSHDANGVDIFFLNHRNSPGWGAASSDNPASGFRNVRTAAEVEALFNRVRPGSATPMGTRINAILSPYLREYEAAVRRTGNPEACGVKPVNMIVITDGEPTDDPEAVIVKIARKLDALEAPPHQVGIQFFQVGDDRRAAEALRELDDGLASQGVRDIVDTVSWESRSGGRTGTLSADAILKVVLGAVVKRLDRRRMSGESRRAGHLAPP
ncbi:hypothetical protein C8A05DRAFT_40751 [Staphylotrichum tortipilum]|uniref:VWFA domain-containing protein n=1 Tax=Staphylotrichum tortipilum TaxID=2831512 RepID=A0AAN6MTU3_9PEZI|nr:hypothetical protein C8A05DRAFT_40751 [Staphylotrichum longicolle]